LEWSIAQRNCSGERVSGDAALAIPRGDNLFLALIDGHGHGELANEVAVAAATWLEQNWTEDLEATFHGLHAALRGGRGAAASLALVEGRSGRGVGAGVGNVVTRTLGQRESLWLTSSDGVLGQSFRTPQVRPFALQEQHVLLMYSDGVSSGFSFEDYPQVSYLGPVAIARTVIRRFARVFDDATCIAVRFAR
jgi:serine/threonine protein phosphatase PrpC